MKGRIVRPNVPKVQTSEINRLLLLGAIDRSGQPIGYIQASYA
jgi:hypothetical protein